MLYEITHRTEFTYTEPAFLEPHLVRLRPRSDGAQHLHAFQLHVTPEPAGTTELLESDGTAAARMWFSGLTDHLTIETRSRVETRRQNPWDYLPLPGAERLPVLYAPGETETLARYRTLTASSDPVARLAEGSAQEAGGQPVPFLSRLCTRIYEQVRVRIRDEGWPLPPEQTLTEAEGSCRDLTLLFMDAARWMGFAARFVSGYQEGDPDQKERHLHAWAEVYIPGAGWRGYDPTHGLAVADRHIALAAGALPESAAPVVGTFRGTGVSASMTAHIEIREVSS